MKYKKQLLIASIAIGIVGILLISLRSPSPSASDDAAWSDLEETNHGYSSWGLEEGGEGAGPFTWNGKSVSLIVAIEGMQDCGVINAKWVDGEEYLLNKFYDISFTGETKRDIALSFYDWVNNNFSIKIEEKDVEMKILSLRVPELNSKISNSVESGYSMSTKSIAGHFGAEFTGTTSSELCSWLQERSGKPVISRDETGRRYDFFLPSVWPDEVLNAATKIGFQLKEEKAVISVVVIKNQINK